jgi:hypothetical protein
MMIHFILTVTRNPIVSLPLLITFVAAKWLRGGALTDERLVGSADIQSRPIWPIVTRWCGR